MTRLRSLGLAVVSVLLATLVGCGPSQSNATATAAAPTAAPTLAQTRASAAPTGAPKSAPITAPTAAARATVASAATTAVSEEIVGDVVDIELSEKIRTYRETGAMVSTIDEVAEYDWHTLVEINRDQPASHTVMTGTVAGGQPSDFEIIRIGPDSYMRFGAQWMTASDQEDPLDAIRGMTAWMKPENWRDNENCRYKGRDNVNGEATRHWFCDQSALTGIASAVLSLGTFEEGGLDTWISTEYNVTVRSYSEWKGKNADGKATLLKIENNVFDINKRLEIKPPEGVSKTGLPEDIPLIEGATEVVSISGMVSFKSAQSVEDVTAFYKQAMDDNRWKAGEDSGVTGTLNYAKDKRTAQFMINQDGTSTAVIIIVQEN